MAKRAPEEGNTVTSLFGQVWLWSLLAFLLGVLITWLVAARPAKKQATEFAARLRQLLSERTTAVEQPFTEFVPEGFEPGDRSTALDATAYLGHLVDEPRLDDAVKLPAAPLDMPTATFEQDHSTGADPHSPGELDVTETELADHRLAADHDHVDDEFAGEDSEHTGPVAVSEITDPDETTEEPNEARSAQPLAQPAVTQQLPVQAEEPAPHDMEEPAADVPREPVERTRSLFEPVVRASTPPQGFPVLPRAPYPPRPTAAPAVPPYPAGQPGPGHAGPLRPAYPPQRPLSPQAPQQPQPVQQSHGQHDAMIPPHLRQPPAKRPFDAFQKSDYDQ